MGHNFLSTIILASGDVDVTGQVSKVTNTGGREYVGGGDILQYLFSEKWDWRLMNGPLIDFLRKLGLYKVLLCLLIITIAIIIALKVLGIKSVRQSKGIKAEVNNIETIRRRDKKILKYNRLINHLTILIKSLGFGVSEVQREYLDYNIKRAGILAPGGMRTMTSEEYNALIKVGSFLTALGCLVVMIFVNTSLGAILLILSLTLWMILPMKYIRALVMEKDREIKEGFFNFYIEIHYILKDGGEAHLNRKARSYAKMSNSQEMSKFADNCADIWELYGESLGSSRISKEYREIPEVGKLMRLIMQFNDGADIRKDLEGFRQQLLLERQMKLEAKQQKLIKKARMSFNVLMILLLQAIISAMAIYAPDLTNITNIF